MSIIDQIDLSLEKASSLQQKRFEAEESKQKSLNYELNQLRNQLNESQEDQDEEMTPERSHSQNYSQSQYSPLRNDIKQLELQKQLLQSSERKLQQEIDESDNDDNQLQIYPKYDKQFKQQNQQQQQQQVQQKQQQDQSKQNNKTQKESIQKMRSKKHHQLENNQIKKDFQQKTQKSVPKSTQIITTTTERRNDKENGFVIQEQKPEYQKLKQHIKSVKAQVSNQLVKNEKTKLETQNDESNQYKIRGFRDQAEIKYFGRPLPCNECVFLLNKGMSSDYCSQHGKMNKERPPNKTLPKRFAKFF
ncbi:unnamed protein product [Paramecium pentaurelia]|uniref:Uncharacterized protein n=1 Tax=Paramecium pentaurelia TaxID=43138 RepID=A0A8S1VYY8_9CILI|nr:unnamed protein product [Paramecium pentaurelia]